MKGLGGGAGEAKSKAGFGAGRSPKSQLPLKLRALSSGDLLSEHCVS